MCIKEAIAKRFQQLCQEQNIAYQELAILCHLAPSTVYGIMNAQHKYISFAAIKKLCDGLNVSIPVFFNDPIFEELEQEI